MFAQRCGDSEPFLMSERNISKILVIDLMHQGNGTVEIFAKEPKVFTFSMHGKENYPLHQRNLRFDIELPTYTTDDTYLNLLYDTLPRALIQQVQPQFLFFISGVDILPLTARKVVG